MLARAFDLRLRWTRVAAELGKQVLGSCVVSLMCC